MDYAYTIQPVTDAVSTALGSAPESLAYLGEGMDSVAYLANGDTVFRFPKDAETAEASLAERELLPIIADAVDVAVPVPTYFGRIQPSNFPFFGYPLLRGTFLSDLDVATFTAVENETLAQSHVKFLQQLHAIPTEQARKAGVADVVMADDYRADWANVKALLFPLISAELRTFLTASYQTFFDLAESDSYTPVLLHGDLAADHILVNPDTKAITGIIDFGDVFISDPVYDLHWYGETILQPWQEALLSKLPAFSDKKSDAKRRFYYLFNFVQDFIYGVECDLPETVAYGWDNLKRLSAETR